MSMNTWSNASNVVKLPFKTLMLVDIEEWVVSFNHPFKSVEEIEGFQEFLKKYGVQDVTMRDAYGLPVWSLEALIGETTITLSHDAIALCSLALEQKDPKARRVVSETRENISLILPAKKAATAPTTSV